MASAFRIPMVASSLPIVIMVTLPPCFSARRRASSTAHAACGSSSRGMSFRTIRLVPGSIWIVTELAGTIFTHTMMFTSGCSVQKEPGARKALPTSERLSDAGATRLLKPLGNVPLQHHLKNLFAVLDRPVHELGVVLHVGNGPVHGGVERLDEFLQMLIDRFGVRSHWHDMTSGAGPTA